MRQVTVVLMEEAEAVMARVVPKAVVARVEAMKAEARVVAAMGRERRQQLLSAVVRTQ